jgi:crotonobetainyl-CoA:carnitine CoA-transferase CaiB-like acyl-CoA transferase
MDSALKGVRVLDDTHVLSAPITGKMLAELGADVIKLEPTWGSRTRGSMLYKGESYYSMHTDCQKKCITLNIRNPRGKEIFMELIKKSDIFLENYRPGSLDRMGLGYEDQKKVNPEIIYGCISGYGYVGPMAKRPGFDFVSQARGGVMSVTGFRGNKPTMSGVSIVDILAGTHLALCCLAALNYKNRTGKGQRINISLYDAAVNFMMEHAALYFQSDQKVIPMQSGNHGIYATTRKTEEMGLEYTYKAKDGYVFFQGLQGNFEGALKVIGREDLVGDTRYDSNEKRNKRTKEIHKLFEDWMKTRTRKEIIDTFYDVGEYLIVPVQNFREIFNDEQTKAKKLFVEVEHPKIGKVWVPRSPFHLSETPGRVEWPGLPLGYNNEEVYGELGYSKEEVSKLREDGVI